MVPPFYVVVGPYGLVEDTPCWYCPYGAAGHPRVFNTSYFLVSSHLLIFLSASQMQVECGQRVGMEGRRLSPGTCNTVMFVVGSL
jgi:hypothetical protein